MRWGGGERGGEEEGGKRAPGVGGAMEEGKGKAGLVVERGENRGDERFG